MYRFIEHICPWIQWRAYNVQPIYLTTSLTYHWGWYMGHDAPLYIFSQWLPAIPITSRATQLEGDRFYAKVTGVRAKAYAYFGLPSYERCFYTYSVQTIRSTSIEIETTLCSLSANSHFEQEICIGYDYWNISSKPVTHSRLPDRGCFEIASLIAQILFGLDSHLIIARILLKPGQYSICLLHYFNMDVFLLLQKYVSCMDRFSERMEIVQTVQTAMGIYWLT